LIYSTRPDTQTQNGNLLVAQHHFPQKGKPEPKTKKTKLYFVDFKNGGLDGVAQNCNDVG